MRTLGPSLSHMIVHGATSPPILLCRVLWLLGCWIDKVPCQAQGDVVGAIVTVIGSTKDLATRLTALSCLDGDLKSLLTGWVGSPCFISVSAAVM